MSLILGLACCFQCVMLQAPDAGAADGRDQQFVQIARLGTGVVQASDRILALGPGYRASFDARGGSLEPRGASAPVMRWRLDGIERRDGSGASVGLAWATVEPRIVGETVEYERGSVVERYDPRADGIEQSFVFGECPPGKGDLVVRLRVETELAADTQGDWVEDLVLASRAGGISIGAVTGIDALGNRVPGQMRYANGALELSLPGHWLDNAVYPVVLDPLLGTPFSTGETGGGSFQAWDVSYDPGQDVFLVAWTEVAGFVFPGAASLGRRVRPDGTLVGPLLCLECGANPSSTEILISVANVRSRGYFVAWFSNYPVVVVNAATGLVRVGNTLNLPFVPRILQMSSNASTVSDEIVVARLEPGALVMVDKLQVDLNGQVTLLKSVQLGTGWYATPTQSGGDSGRRVILWGDATQPIVWATVIDRDLNVLDKRIVAQTALSVGVEGNGNQWLLVANPSSGPTCTPMFWDAATGKAWLGMAQRLPLLSPSVQGHSIAWLGESFLISHRDRTSLFEEVSSVDPFTCLPCEPRSIVSGVGYLRIASQRQGNIATGDRALLSDWIGISQVYRADDGITTDLGGGCGTGGWSAASCARVGNEGFRVRVREARVGVPAFLVLGTQPLAFPCGTCTLMVNPLTVVGAGLTDVHGNAEVLLPIANNPGWIGQAFVEQWFTVGGTACSLGIEMSNARRVQLQ